MRSTYRILNFEYPQFVTSTIINWINIFSSDIYFEIMLENFRFYQNFEFNAFPNWGLGRRRDNWGLGRRRDNWGLGRSGKKPGFGKE